MTRLRKDWWIPYAFLALPLLMYLIYVLFPIVESMLFAFTKTDTILYGTKFVGLRNFGRLFTDSTFLLALKNNFFWLVFFVAIPVPLGLLIAMFFNNAYFGIKIFKTLFYLPMTLSFAVIGTIWAWIYHPDFGVLNTVLRSIGLGEWAKPWLGDKRYMTFSLIVVGIWRQIPYVMILYLAGLKNVPGELVEAAMIDGATWWQRFLNIVIPMVSPATVVAVTISIIDSLRSFDIIYVMTNTKARAAEVLATYMYSSAFTYSDYGYGSAIAVIQFLITFGFIYFYVSHVMKTEMQR